MPRPLPPSKSGPLVQTHIHILAIECVPNSRRWCCPTAKVVFESCRWHVQHACTVQCATNPYFDMSGKQSQKAIRFKHDRPACPLHAKVEVAMCDASSRVLVAPSARSENGPLCCQ